MVITNSNEERVTKIDIVYQRYLKNDVPYKMTTTNG